MPAQNETKATDEKSSDIKDTSDLPGFEEARVSSSINGTSATRGWLIKKPERVSKANVALELAVPGIALVDTLTYSSYPDPLAGYVMAQGDNLDSLGQVEAISTHGSDAETVQVHFKPKTGTPVTTGSFTTYVSFHKDFNVTTSTTSKWVQVHKDALKQPFDDYETTKFVSTTNYGQGSVFVSDPKSVLALETLSVDNYGDGIVQMDVDGTWTTFGVSLDTITYGSISCFGDFIYSYALPDPGKSGNICLNSTSQARISVGAVDPKRQAQVSYTGQSGGSPCEKKTLPERIPTKISTADGQESLLQTVQANTAGVSAVTVVVLLLATLISC